MNFKTKIIGSVVVPTIILISIASMGLALSSHQKKQADVKEKVLSSINQTVLLLNESDSMMMDRTVSAMSVLKHLTYAGGKPSAKKVIAVAPGVLAPNIYFGRRAQALNFRIVDKLVKLVGGSATIFSKSGDSFVRIATNIKKPDGSRAVGTVLDPSGPAYAALQKGQGFEGVVDILGTPFFTSYQPILDKQKKLIGIYYVGYKAQLSSIQSAVGATKILEGGFLAVLDAAGKVRFISKGVDPEKTAQLVRSDHEGWTFVSQEVPGWNYKVYAAYKESELRSEMLSSALWILGGGLTVSVLLAALLASLLESSVLTPLGGSPHEASAIAERIRSGDLTSESRVRRKKGLLSTMDDMNESLTGVVGEVRAASTRIATASSQISEGSDDLQERTQQQAASLEETAVNMEELTATVRQTLDSTVVASKKAELALKVADRGVENMKHVIEIMSAVGAASKKVSDITGVIEGIAFQTNILALNAAVEAARAGEQGRGFAVVATEVRNLAKRSAEAAKEISLLIATSVSRVDDGFKAAATAGETMEEIVVAIKDNSRRMSEIASACAEQSSGIEGVNRSIIQIDEATQKNAALAEETSAAAEEMQEQADELLRSVNFFKLKE